MLGKLVVLIFGIVYVRAQIPGGGGAGRPPIGVPGGFSQGTLDDHREANKIRSVALLSIEHLMKDQLPFWPMDPNCRINLVDVENYQTQVVAGTIHKFDVQVEWSDKCGSISGDIHTCSNVRVLESLPSDCRSGSCFEAVQEDEVECISTNIEPADFCAGCLTVGVLEDEVKADSIKKLVSFEAGKHLKKMNRWSNGDDYCGLNFFSVDRYEAQLVAGTMHSIDATLKYNRHCGSYFGKLASCRGFRVFEDLPFNCELPGGKCLDLDDSSNINCDLIDDFTEEPEGAGCPGCLSEGIIENERNADLLKEMAAREVLDKVKSLEPQFNFNDECAVNVDRVENYRSQVVAGFIHKFDVILKWNNQCRDGLKGSFSTCRDVSILESLSNGYEAIDLNEVRCTN